MGIFATSASYWFAAFLFFYGLHGRYAYSDIPPSGYKSALQLLMFIGGFAAPAFLIWYFIETTLLRTVGLFISGILGMYAMSIVLILIGGRIWRSPMWQPVLSMFGIVAQPVILYCMFAAIP